MEVLIDIIVKILIMKKKSEIIREINECQNLIDKTTMEIGQLYASLIREHVNEI